MRYSIRISPCSSAVIVLITCPIVLARAKKRTNVFFFVWTAMIVRRFREATARVQKLHEGIQQELAAKPGKKRRPAANK